MRTRLNLSLRGTLRALVTGWLLLGVAQATTLPPELKAYDFAEAYYIEDGGVVISKYDHGFYCPQGIKTPEGIRVMPGDTFTQYDAGRQLCEEYRFLRLDDTQAFFHERIYRYHLSHDARGRDLYVRDNYVGSDDFYLTQWRGLEWFDYAFPEVELHPGLQEWRSKNYFNGGR